jgi:hypothetical protein
MVEYFALVGMIEKHGHDTLAKPVGILLISNLFSFVLGELLLRVGDEGFERPSHDLFLSGLISFLLFRL